MSRNVRRTMSTIGAEISGGDLSQGLSETARQEIERLLLELLVLVFSTPSSSSRPPFAARTQDRASLDR